MKTALEYYGHISDRERMMVRAAQKWIDKLPSVDPNQVEPENALWSCHVVTRALKLRFPTLYADWEVVDGYWHRGRQHAWLVRREPVYLVLDVYPVASFGGPVLVDGQIYGEFYIPRPDLYTAKIRGFGFDANRLCHLTTERSGA